MKKRELILAVIAVFLLIVGFLTTWGWGVLIFLWILLVYFLDRSFFRKKNVDGVSAQDEASRIAPMMLLDDIMKHYGQPDDVVVLDASRANEMQSLILFYHATDMAVITGSLIKISEITSVAPKNLALPYTVDEWAVIINTSNKLHPVFRLRVGYDGGLASEIADQIFANWIIIKNNPIYQNK